MPFGVAGFLALDLWRAWYSPSVEIRLWIRADQVLDFLGPLNFQPLTRRRLSHNWPMPGGGGP